MKNFIEEVAKYKGLHYVYTDADNSLLIQIPIHIKTAWNVLSIKIEENGMWTTKYDVYADEVEDVAKSHQKCSKVLFELVDLWKKHIGKVPRVLR